MLVLSAHFCLSKLEALDKIGVSRAQQDEILKKFKNPAP